MNGEYNHAYIYVDDVKTHYIEAGEGAPLVLVHGGGAGSSGEANYGDVIGPLGENFHAIAPDLIGYGYTAPRGLQDMNGEAEGNFLVRFIETIDVGPVFLGGNSHGGFLTQYAAHERPDLVKRLIIINSFNGTSPYPPLPEGRKYIFGPGGHQVSARALCLRANM